MTRQKPYKKQAIPTDNQQFMKEICRGVRPNIPADCPDEIQSLMEDCWETNPHKRPLFKDVVTRLDEILEYILV